MPFTVLPAIDVAGGRLVSASGGTVRAVAAFGGSPAAAARAFVEAGAEWLHVVDVDRAAGRPPDLGVVRELSSLGTRVQASGGIGSSAAAHAALEAGASRVVIGSAMLGDRPAVSDVISELGGRVVVGIETDRETIRPRSADGATLGLQATLSWLATTRARRYLYTAVARMAGLHGPDVEGARSVAGVLGRPLLVAGGIRSVDDVTALRELGDQLVDGAVVGRALYEGLDLGLVLSALA